MRIHPRALKREARLCMHRASPNAYLMTFVYLLLTSGLSLVVGLVAADPLMEMLYLYSAGLDLGRAFMLTVSRVGAVGLFLNILMLIYSVVMGVSYLQWCLGTSRGGIGEFADLMSGFSMVGRIILLSIATLMYCFMWYVVILVPASVAIVYMAFVMGAGVLLAVPMFLAAMALYFICILRYSMAFYCLIDEPEKGAFHALRSSLRLMRGRCAELFVILLSFAGWFLLGGLISGIGVQIAAGVYALVGVGGMSELNVIADTIITVVPVLVSLPLYIWLTPYITMTHCKYYDQLKKAETA